MAAAADAPPIDSYWFNYAQIVLLDNPYISAGGAAAVLAAAAFSGNEIRAELAAAFHAIDQHGAANTTSQLAHRGGGPKHEGGGGMIAGLASKEFNYAVIGATIALAVRAAFDLGRAIATNHPRYDAMAAALGEIKSGKRNRDNLQEFTGSDQKLIRLAF